MAEELRVNLIGIDRLSGMFENAREAFGRFAAALARGVASMRTNLSGLIPHFGRLGREQDKAGRSTEKLSNSIWKLTGRLRGLMVIAVAFSLQPLITGVIQLGSAVVSLAASLTQAAAVLGGAFVAGIAQAIPVVGLLVVAMASVTKVLKAVSEQETQAKRTGTELRSEQMQQKVAAEALRNAHIRLVDSHKALSQARKEAKRDLEDLTLTTRRNLLAVRESRLASMEAAAGRRGAIRGGGAFDIARAGLGEEGATLDRISAERDYKRSVEDTQEQIKKGIAQNDQVVNARRELRAATLALEQAELGLKQATEGSGSGLNKMMKDLTVAERQLVKDIIELKKTFKTEFGPIRDIMVGGISSVVKDLGKALRNPELKSAARSLATSLSGAFKSFGTFISNPRFIHQWSLIWKESARNVPLVAKALQNLATIFTNIAQGAAPVLRILLKDFVELTSKWAAAKPEAIEQFFLRNLKHMKAWFALIGALGGLLKEVISIFADSGTSLVESMTSSINDLTQYLKDNREEVREFANDAIEGTKQIWAVIVDIGKALGEVFDPASVKEFTLFLREVVIPILQNVMLAITSVSRVIRLLMSLPVVSELIVWTATFGAMYLSLQRLLTIIPILGTTITTTFLGIPIVGWIAAIIVVLIEVQRRWQGVTKAIEALQHAAKWTLDWLKDNWGKVLLVVLTGGLGLAIVAFQEWGDEILGFFKTLPEKLGELGYEAGKALIGKLAEGVEWMLDQIPGSGALKRLLGFGDDTPVDPRRITPSGPGTFDQGALVNAGGGIVPGSGSGDTVAAWLTPGEAVLNRRQQEMVGSQRIMRVLRATGAPTSGSHFARGLMPGDPGYGAGTPVSMPGDPGFGTGVRDYRRRVGAQTVNLLPAMQVGQSAADTGVYSQGGNMANDPPGSNRTGPHFYDCSGLAGVVASKVPGYKGGIGGTTGTYWAQIGSHRGADPYKDPVTFGWPSPGHMFVTVKGTAYNAHGHSAGIDNKYSPGARFRVPLGLEYLRWDATSPARAPGAGSSTTSPSGVDFGDAAGAGVPGVPSAPPAPTTKEVPESFAEYAGRAFGVKKTDDKNKKRRERVNKQLKMAIEKNKGPLAWYTRYIRENLYAANRKTKTITVAPAGSGSGSVATDPAGYFPPGGTDSSKNTTNQNRALGQQMAAQKGWTGDQWTALDRLWTGESGWDHKIWNRAGSGAYGIPQALPASKMASMGADYLTNPVTQIAWGLKYIKDRHDYGSPLAAWNKWLSRSPHWYDQGGMVPGGGPVPIVAHGGEMVLNKGHQAALGGTNFLRRKLNLKTGGRSFKDGGIVLPAPVRHVRGGGGGAEAVSAEDKAQINEVMRSIRMALDPSFLVNQARRALRVVLRTRFGIEGFYNQLVDSFSKFEEGFDAIKVKQERVGKVLQTKIIRRAVSVVRRGGQLIAGAIRGTGPGDEVQSIDDQIEQGQLGLNQAGANRRMAVTNLGQARQANTQAIERLRKNPKSKEARLAVEQTQGAIQKWQNQIIDSNLEIAQSAQAMIELQRARSRAVVAQIEATAETGFKIGDSLRRQIELTSGDRGVINQLIAQKASSLYNLRTELGHRLNAANAAGDATLANELFGRIADIDAQIRETLVERIQVAADFINKDAARIAQRSEARIRQSNAGLIRGQDFSLIGQELASQGGSLQAQRQGLTALALQAQAAGQNEQFNDLMDQIIDLDAAIAENTKAIRDNTVAAFEFRSEERKGAFGFQSGRLDLLSRIAEVGTAAGFFFPNVQEQIGITRERGGLLAQDEAAIRTELAEAMRTPDLLRDQIRDLQLQLLQNQLAQLENTKQLMELNGELGKPQIASRGWQWFREAFFNESGLLPKYSVPQLQTGGYITRTGLFKLEAGEAVIRPDQMKPHGGGENHFHFTQPVEISDPEWFGRRAAFEMKSHR